MYAIVEVGGRQWKVQEGSKIEVNSLAAEAGTAVEVDRVLLAQDGEKIQVGKPYLQGARVVCEVVEHSKGPKVITYKFRRRENYRKTIGHRQSLTKLVVKAIKV
jgi:large subunit ribosomal protein L21